MLVVGVVFLVLLSIGAAVLLTRDDATHVRTLRPSDHQTASGVTAPRIPAFRFTMATRELVPTAPGRIKRRQREAIVRAAGAAREVLARLYTEGFLDPANWQRGRYADAFRGFAGGARKQAEARSGLLTAGPRAGDLYEQILPASGRIATRILLDRGGYPALLVSIVRFSAAADGSVPTSLRSTGQFFLERVGESWKIVSFHVTRADAPKEGA
jgi:hypothetical protein